MIKLLYLLQITIGLGILNVWFLRPSVKTPYRGGTAASLKEEFKAYGLPDWFRISVGILKTLCALGLIAGLWFPFLTFYAAAALALLMLGAIAMHVKVKDALIKFVPATVVLIMCLIVLYLSSCGC